MSEKELREALEALLNECYHCEGTDGYHSCGMDTTEAYEKAAALINFNPAPDVLEGP